MGICIKARKTKKPFDVSEGREWRFRIMPRKDELFNKFAGDENIYSGRNGVVWRSDKNLTAEELQHKQEQLGKIGVTKDAFGKASAIVGGVASIAEKSMSLAEIADTSEIEGGIDDLANSDYTSAGSNRSLLSQWNSTKWQKSDYTSKDVRGMSGGEMAGQIGGATIDGAMAGLQAGGPWGAVAGAAVGLGSSLGGMFAGNAKARRKAEELNDAAAAANRDATNAFTQANSQLAQQNFNAQMANLSAYGGAVDRWRTLTLADRSRLIGLYVRNGMTDLASMRSHYNGMAYGGRKDEEEERTKKRKVDERPLSPAASLIGGEHGRLIDAFMYGGRLYDGTDDTDSPRTLQDEYNEYVARVERVYDRQVRPAASFDTWLMQRNKVYAAGGSDGDDTAPQTPPGEADHISSSPTHNKPSILLDDVSGKIQLVDTRAYRDEETGDYYFNMLEPAVSVAADVNSRSQVKSLADELYSQGLDTSNVILSGPNERKTARYNALLTKRYGKDVENADRKRKRFEEKIQSIRDNTFLPEEVKEMLILSEMPMEYIMEEARKGNPNAVAAAARAGIERYGVPIAIGSTLGPYLLSTGLSLGAPFLLDSLAPALGSALSWAAGTGLGQATLATAGSPMLWGALAINDAAQKTYRNIRYGEPISWYDVAQTGVDMALATLPLERGLEYVGKGIDAAGSLIKEIPKAGTEMFNRMMLAPMRRSIKDEIRRSLYTSVSEALSDPSILRGGYGVVDFSRSAVTTGAKESSGKLYSIFGFPMRSLTSSEGRNPMNKVLEFSISPYKNGKQIIDVPGIGEMKFRVPISFSGNNTAKILFTKRGPIVTRFIDPHLTKFQIGKVAEYDKAISDTFAAIEAKYPGLKRFGSGTISGIPHAKHDFDFLCTDETLGKIMSDPSVIINPGGRAGLFTIKDPQFGDLDVNLVSKSTATGKENFLELFKEFFPKEYGALTLANVSSPSRSTAINLNEIRYTPEELISAYDPEVKSILDVMLSKKGVSIHDKTAKQASRTFSNFAYADTDALEKAVDLYLQNVLTHKGIAYIPYLETSNKAANRKALSLMCFPIDVSDDPRRMQAVWRYFYANSIVNYRASGSELSVDLLSNILYAPYRHGSLQGAGLNTIAGATSEYKNDIEALIPILFNNTGKGAKGILKQLNRATGQNIVFTKKDAKAINSRFVKAGDTPYSVLMRTRDFITGLQSDIDLGKLPDQIAIKNYEDGIKEIRELFDSLRDTGIFALSGPISYSWLGAYRGLVDYATMDLNAIKFVEGDLDLGSYWYKLQNLIESSNTKAITRPRWGTAIGTIGQAAALITLYNWWRQASILSETGEPDYDSAEEMLEEMLQEIRDERVKIKENYYRAVGIDEPVEINSHELLSVLYRKLHNKAKEEGVTTETWRMFGQLVKSKFSDFADFFRSFKGIVDAYSDDESDEEKGEEHEKE